jgi:hypothetical protein
MRKAGHKLLYAPEIRVWHRLPADRLTKASFRERFFRVGKTEAYLMPLRWPLWRFGIYSVKRILLNTLQSVWLSATGKSAKSLVKQCDVYQVAGTLWQHWLFRRSGRKHDPFYKTQIQPK